MLPPSELLLKRVLSVFKLHELAYTLIVRNLTVSLPDAILEALRAKARASGKSLNAWVGEVLQREAVVDSTWAEDLSRITAACAEQVRSDWKWNRQDLYENRVSRH